MRVTAGEGVRVTAQLKVDELHEGPPGLAHGGVLAAALDEVLGYLAWMLREPTVTARLDTRFRRPVPTGFPVHIAAECLGVSGRKVFGRATGRLGRPDGELAVLAEALLVTVPLAQFPTHSWPDVPPRHRAPGPQQSAAGERRAQGAL
jgi:acyl-coenzyme A thioesterase PaaI-like protein